MNKLKSTNSQFVGRLKQIWLDSDEINMKSPIAKQGTWNLGLQCEGGRGESGKSSTGGGGDDPKSRFG